MQCAAGSWNGELKEGRPPPRPGDHREAIPPPPLAGGIDRTDIQKNVKRQFNVRFERRSRLKAYKRKGKIQTDRQTDRVTDRHTDRQTDRQTYRQTDRQIDRSEKALAAETLESENPEKRKPEVGVKSGAGIKSGVGRRNKMAALNARRTDSHLIQRLPLFDLTLSVFGSMSFGLFVCHSFCPAVYLSVCLPVGLYVGLSVCLFVGLSVCL